MSPNEVELKLAMLPYQDMIRKLEAALSAAVGERVGVALLTYPLNRPGVCNWVCNAERAGMAEIMRGLIAKWEQEGSVPTPSEN